MSIKTTTRVWEQSRQKGSLLLLLLAIADFADDNGFAWPGIETLAGKMRMTPRHTSRLIGSLEQAGELRVLGRRGRVNLYVVLCGLTEEMLKAALERAAKRGAVVESLTPDRLSGAESHPPATCRGGMTICQGTPDIAMSSDPSLPVIETPGVVDDDLTEEQEEALTALMAFGWDKKKTARPYARKHDPKQIIGLIEHARECGLTVAWVRSQLNAGEWAPQTEDASAVLAADVRSPEPAAPVHPRLTEAQRLGVDPGALAQWRRVLDRLQCEMTRATFETWLRGTVPLLWEDGRATILVGSSEAADWLQNRLSVVVERAASGVSGRPMSLTYQARTGAKGRNTEHSGTPLVPNAEAVGSVRQGTPL